jgi:hypothetical protein
VLLSESAVSMKNAALGFRMHSGWGAVVAVSNEGKFEVVDRRHIVLTKSRDPALKQPYHHVESFELKAAGEYLAKCSATSGQLALTAVREILVELADRKYQVRASAILAASGRTLPSLEKVLASHPLIHTAEGEFFRAIVHKACEEAGLAVVRLRERELEEDIEKSFGSKANHLKQCVSGLGKHLGPPWTQDEKFAALAAALVLASGDPSLARVPPCSP